MKHMEVLLSNLHFNSYELLFNKTKNQESLKAESRYITSGTQGLSFV